LPKSYQHLAGGRRVRELTHRRGAACEELDGTPLNLTSARPVISKENVLLIEGIHEGLSHSIELWQSWGQPEIWRLPHGHVSTIFMPGLSGRILRWLVQCPISNGYYWWV